MKKKEKQLLIMSNKEKVEFLPGVYQRQYHHNTYPEFSDNSEFITSKEEIKNACMEMAEWKNKQFEDDIYKFCMYCESKLLKDKKHLGCAFRSLGNEYCDFIDDMLKKYK